MMYFQDRRHAGQLLVPKLETYRNRPDAIVIGLPRGGVVVAYEVAAALHLPLDIISPRKIGAPYNPEFAIGAITETGEGVFDRSVIEMLSVSPGYIKAAIEEEKKKAQQRLISFRKGMPKRDLKDKIVILVDDGIATGSTMKAAIQSAKAEKAAKIVVAVPVSPVDTYAEIGQQVDEMICLATPSDFQAVGQFYREFEQTEDDEVLALMKVANQKK